MEEQERGEVTQALTDLAAGDRSAVNRAFPGIYRELRSLAGSMFPAREGDHTLQPTALVHEAFVRIANQSQPVWNDRRHFFDVAAMAMRQLLTDYARRSSAAKRGGQWRKVTLRGITTPSLDQRIDVLSLEEALSALEKLDPRQGRVVQLRFLAGLSIEETAEVLGVSARTVKLDWQMAKAWLSKRMDEFEAS